MPVLDKIIDKLTGWKGKILSLGGNLTLIKAVLAAMPTYFYMTCNGNTIGMARRRI